MWYAEWERVGITAPEHKQGFHFNTQWIYVLLCGEEPNVCRDEIREIFFHIWCRESWWWEDKARKIAVRWQHASTSIVAAADVMFSAHFLPSRKHFLNSHRIYIVAAMIRITSSEITTLSWVCDGSESYEDISFQVRENGKFRVAHIRWCRLCVELTLSHTLRSNTLFIALMSWLLDCSIMSI